MWIERVDDSRRDGVIALAGRAQAADGVAPLNEEAHFLLTGAGAEHFLIERDGHVLGYAQWQPGPATAQIVVDPTARRRGVGTMLADAVRQHATERVWAFGDLAAAQALAARRGLGIDRALWLMGRPLSADDTPPEQPDGPSGLTLRSFRPGDETALLDVNHAAFAHHPEQGALDLAGLQERMAEPWFDPDDLILGFDEAGLAGFHWTKPHDAVTGEVYVIGVAPRTQGRGFGRALLNAGLRRLAATGHSRVVLYVDSAEAVAVELYETAGFSLIHRDVLYTPRQEERP